MAYIVDMFSQAKTIYSKGSVSTFQKKVGRLQIRPEFLEGIADYKESDLVASGRIVFSKYAPEESNWCYDCPMFDLCNSDECAMNEANANPYGTRFHDLGQYIDFLKKQGWR